MRGQTTDPDIANPFAATGLAPAELRAQIEAAFARRDKKPKRAELREPDLFWEEPGLHGSGREVQLRPTWTTDDAVKRIRAGRVPMTELRLPPAPVRGVDSGQVVLVAGLVVSAGALAWYLWKRKQVAAASKTMPSTMVRIPDWAMS